jgi:hypothetical protein
MFGNLIQFPSSNTRFALNSYDENKHWKIAVKKSIKDLIDKIDQE